MIGSRQGLSPQQLPWGAGRDNGIWQGEMAPWRGDVLPEQELTYTGKHEVELKVGGPVYLGQAGAVDKLPTKPGIYFIYINGAIWYVGKGTSIRGRFQDRMKTFQDFNLSPKQYLDLLRPVTVRYYEIVRFTDPKGSLFKTREKRSKDKGKKLRTGLGLLRAMEQHFILKLGTRSKGNKAADECVSGTGLITLRYKDSAQPSETIPQKIFC